MRIKVLFFIVVIFICGCLQNNKNKRLEPTAEQIKTQGIFDFGQKSIDLGVVKDETVLSWMFNLNNVGTEAIKVIEYSVSCSCTAASLNDSVIPPAKTGYFTMKIDTKGKFPGGYQTDAVLKTNGKRTFYTLTARYIIE